MELKDIKIYNKDFKLLAVIPRFVAANWELKFCGYGCGEIEIERDDEIVSILYDNEYLFLVQDGIQSVVTGYKIGKSCTVFTRTLEWLLTKFVADNVTAGNNLSNTIENILSTLPKNFEFEFSGIEDEYDMSNYKFTKARDIYSEIAECIGDKNVGFTFRVDFASQVFKFSLVLPQENKDLLMCDEYKTSYDTELTHHIQDKASGAVYYHDVTYMGEWRPSANEPTLAENPKHFGNYYKVTEDGRRFGIDFLKGEFILCKSRDGKFCKVTKAEPFLTSIPPEDNGIFSWSEMIDAHNEKEAAEILSHKKSMDLLTAKTKLSYKKDYNLGDIIKTKFYGRDKDVTVKKIVTEIHLWTEYGQTGESPVMKDLNEEDENGL